MRANIKRKLLWSSLGGLALGAAVALLRRPKNSTTIPLTYEPIPTECKKIIIWTERFKSGIEGRPYIAHDEYLLQSTPFRVWNVLDLTSSAARTRQDGSPIYHATVVRNLEPEGSDALTESPKTLERFYGTVSILDPAGKSPGLNYLARGAILEMRKCLVGGASNGIETGDVHRSAGRILNYRFEYSAPAED